ncbi:MAG TPA: glycosyltransferase family 4 protein [Solirubrobacterales bacterium]|nr:glycosyltransferase family 4 protein [Solirubrobacterales bacterium]
MISGLREAGCDVVPVDAGHPALRRIGDRLGMSWADQAANPMIASLSGRIADRRLRAAGQLDGVVMIGSGYSLSTSLPLVTFEDMTVAQALGQPEPVYESLAGAAATRWRERQGRNYERSRGCCVASNWAARSLRDDYGVPAAKVHVVGFGANVAIDPAGRNWEPPRFLFVGVDWERKRGAAVVEGFAAVRERYPEAQLELVGKHARVEASGVIDHGLLPLGSEQARNRYVELLEGATCLVMPSRFEPFGIAYLDAAVAGTPSIGTTAGGAADAVGEGGLLVDPEDEGALAEAMVSMADADTAKQLGARARARLPQITWRAVAERVLGALGLAGSGSGRSEEEGES